LQIKRINKRPRGTIPQRGNHYYGGSMVPLGLLAVGETAEVAETRIEELFAPCSGCKCDRPECFGRLEDMGLRAGKTVEILNNHRAHGVLLVKVDDSRIALNRGMAMKIMVRRQDR
jgi:ferrous iron transport protein A